MQIVVCGLLDRCPHGLLVMMVRTVWSSDWEQRVTTSGVTRGGDQGGPRLERRLSELGFIGFNGLVGLS